jgi:hypothetical protein
LSCVLILGEHPRSLASCLSWGNEGFAQRIPVKDPGCREPETGTDKTDCIPHGESRRADLFDQRQAHGPKGFVGEENDAEGREREDEVAEKARPSAVVRDMLRGNEGEDPKDEEREEVNSQSNRVRPTELYVWNRERLNQCHVSQQGTG